MNYRNIISESWNYTQSKKKLIFWFGFIPSIFTTTVGAGYIAYQFLAFRGSYLFSDEETNFFFDIALLIWEFLKDHISWTVPLIIITVLFLLFYLLYPTLAKAAAIQVISRNRTGQKDAGPGTGLRHGLFSFLPLFEYHLLIKTFSFFSVLIQMSFVIRNLGPSMFQAFLPLYILIMIIGLILTLLFTYTDFFIVIDGKRVFSSIKASAKMVILNWKCTVLITILMILIGVRIIIQVIMVFLIPFLVILLTGYIAAIALPVTGVIVGALSGFLVLLLAAYLNGVVDIFSFSVWTFTFLELSKEKDFSPRGDLCETYYTD